MVTTRLMQRKLERELRDSSNVNQQHCDDSDKQTTGQHTLELSTASKTATNPFPFLKLPAEIRNRIYELLLLTGSMWDISAKPERDTYLALQHQRNSSRERLVVRDYERRSFIGVCTQLLRTNKQIYSEAIGMVYLKPFLFHGEQPFKMFSTMVRSRHLKLIKNLTLSLLVSLNSYEFINNPRNPGRSRAVLYNLSRVPARYTAGDHLAACKGLSELRLVFNPKVRGVRIQDSLHCDAIVDFLVDLVKFVENCAGSSPQDAARWPWFRQHGGLQLFRLAWGDHNITSIQWYKIQIAPVSAELKMEVDRELRRRLRL